MSLILFLFKLPQFLYQMHLHNCIHQSSSRTLNVVNKQIIADEFNTFFVNVGPNLAMNIPVVNNAASAYDYMGQQNLNSMFINPVNEAEVIRIIKLCKPKDSMDYDDISMWVLSRIAPQPLR